MSDNFDFTFLAHPKIMSGIAALTHLPHELRSMNLSRPFFMSPSSLGCGLARKAVDYMTRDSDLTVQVFLDDLPDRIPLASIEKLAKIFRENNCDSVIALGGGAFIHGVKRLNLALVTGNFGQDNLSRIPSSREMRFILIPAGALSTDDVSDTVYHEKKIARSPFFMPDLICCDPITAPFTGTQRTAWSIAQGIGDAVELIATEHQDTLVEALATASLQIFRRYSLDAINNKPSAVIAVNNAIIYAGIARSNSKPGLVYRLARELARTTGHDQGLLQGVLLPSYLAIHHVRHELFLATASFTRYSKTPEIDREKAGYVAVKMLLSPLQPHVPASLHQVPIHQPVIEEALSALDEELSRGKEAAFRRELEHWRDILVSGVES